MPLQLGNINAYNNPTQTGSAAATTEASSASATQNAARSQVALTLGQTVQGQVKSLNGNQIVLNLGHNVEINARLSQEANLSVGQNILFEVTSAQNNRIALLPLYTNTAQNSTVLSALKAAELPATTENIQMVSTMIREGMSIDKESVLSMSRLSANYPNYAPSSVVELSSMGMSITEGNLAQIEAYHNMNYQLMDTASQLTSDLGSLVSEYAQNGQLQDGLQFMSAALGTLSGDGMLNTAAAQDLSALGILPGAEGGALDAANVIAMPAEATLAADGALLAETATEGAEGATGALSDGANGAQQAGTALNGTLSQALSGAADALLSRLGMDGDGVSVSISGGVSEEALATLKSAASSGDAQAFVSALNQANVQTVVSAMGDQDLSGQFAQMLSSLQDALSEGAQFPVTYQALNDAFQKLFGAQVSKEWMLSPEEFADKEQVKALYERISTQADALQKTLAGFGKENSAAGSNLGQMQQNLDFMNALNQMYPYVQLPLRASMENAHGDLYVYSNKKGRAQEDGSVSALLHLEMQHLGDMDIYVKLKGDLVSTHFYLEDESVIDFLEGNMHLLDERLSQSGYRVNTEVSGRSELQSNKETVETKDIVSRIRGVDEQHKLISYQSFDVRA